MMDKEMQVLRVSSGTPVRSFAGCIVSFVEQNKDIEVHAIGAGAVNQMVKSLAIANGILAPQGKELLFKPHFKDIKENGKESSAIVVRVVVNNR